MHRTNQTECDGQTNATIYHRFNERQTRANRRRLRVLVRGHEQKRIRTRSSRWFAASRVLKTTLNNKPNCVFTLTLLGIDSRELARAIHVVRETVRRARGNHDYSARPQPHSHSHAHVLRRMHSSAQHTIISLIKSSDFLLIAWFGIKFCVGLCIVGRAIFAAASFQVNFLLMYSGIHRALDVRAAYK